MLTTTRGPTIELSDDDLKDAEIMRYDGRDHSEKSVD